MNSSMNVPDVVKIASTIHTSASVSLAASQAVVLITRPSVEKSFGAQ
jgi:hypothetical protein